MFVSRRGSGASLRSTIFLRYDTVLGSLGHLKAARWRCPLKLDSRPNNVYPSKSFLTHACIYTKDGQNMINHMRTTNDLCSLTCTESRNSCRSLYYNRMSQSLLGIVATLHPYRQTFCTLFPPLFVQMSSLLEKKNKQLVVRLNLSAKHRFLSF